jgi:hypothetical protein
MSAEAKSISLNVPEAIAEAKSISLNVPRAIAEAKSISPDVPRAIAGIASYRVHTSILDSRSRLSSPLNPPILGDFEQKLGRKSPRIGGFRGLKKLKRSRLRLVCTR